MSRKQQTGVQFSSQALRLNDMKTCNRCLQDLPDDSFGIKKSTGTILNPCLKCKREYQKTWEKSQGRVRLNKIRASNEARRVRMLAEINTYKAKHGCADCGEKDPIVLEFDHVRDTKEFTIAARLNRSYEKVWAEIAKCEVVCANCHRRRTVRRRIEKAA